jgi:nucleotide-binding universal stress UspA family protein
MLGFGGKPGRIVVGLDGSKRQPAVLSAAADLAKASGAKLHLVRAVVVPPLPAEVWTMSGDDLMQFLISEAKEELDKLAPTLGVPTEVTARIGVPSDTLCTLAEETGADLIVIGTHGYGALDRVLGTTAAKVVNRAPTSVLVVRDRDAAT